MAIAIPFHRSRMVLVTTVASIRPPPRLPVVGEEDLLEVGFVGGDVQDWKRSVTTLSSVSICPSKDSMAWWSFTLTSRTPGRPSNTEPSTGPSK